MQESPQNIKISMTEAYDRLFVSIDVRNVAKPQSFSAFVQK